MKKKLIKPIEISGSDVISGRLSFPDDCMMCSHSDIAKLLHSVSLSSDKWNTFIIICTHEDPYREILNVGRDPDLKDAIPIPEWCPIFKKETKDA